MQPSFPRLSPYFCVNSLIIGPRICEEDRSISPFCLQYQPQEDGSATPTHIRFIIVRDISDPKLAELVVESWSSPWIEDDERRLLQPTVSYRDVLRYRRERNKRHGQANAITLVFEATYMNEVRIEFICYPEHARPRHSLPRAILLDQTFPLPSSRRPWSTTFYIQSSVQTILYKRLSLDWDIESKERWGRRDEKPTIPSVLHLTVIKHIAKFPTRPSPPLPLNILRRIAFEIIKYRPPMWNLQLFTLGLVSKAWAPLLDMFFELHAAPYSNFGLIGKPAALNPMIYDIMEDRARQPSLILVARSLMNGRPERACLMERFSLAFYREGMRSLTTEERSEPLLAHISCIFHHGRSLKDITIDAASFLTHKWISWTLRRLTLVERCVFTCGHVPISQAQSVVGQWLKLRVFHWEGYRGDFSRPEVLGHHEEDTPEPTLHLQFSLEELRITSDSIIGEDFLRFFNVPSPRLSKLDLDEVHGLTNEDFHSSLSIVSTSLKELRVSHCTFLKQPSEEHAIDALISQMPNLGNLSVSPGPNVLSSLAVARKTAGQAQATLAVNDVADISFFDGFADAIKTSGAAWGRIYLMLHRSFPQDGYAILSEVQSIAVECGIFFFMMVDPLTMSTYNTYGHI